MASIESSKHPQRLAYFINIYPAISHTFIRREIRTLEGMGWDIVRFSIRKETDLVDLEDLNEASRTTSLLPIKLRWLVEGGFLLIRRPVKACRAALMCIQMALRSDRGVFRALFTFVEAVILVNLLKSTRINHCHAHFGTNSTSIVRIAQALGGPGYSFTNHGPFEIDNPYAMSLSDKIQESKFVVAISDFARAQMMRITPPNEWHKLHVIRCSLEFDSTSLPTAISDTARIVCIGRLSAEKGHLVLLRAVKVLTSQNLPLHLIVVGDGPMRSMIELEIRRLELEKVVELIGNVDAEGVGNQLESCRACVLSSFAEGLPMVLMEAFRAGRPVIAPSIGAISELVTQGKSGWLFPPGNSDRLAGALHEALTQPVEDLARMGKHGYDKVTGLHNAEKEGTRLSLLFGEVVEGPL